MCDHKVISIQKCDPTIRSDGVIQWSENSHCDNCGEQWRTLKSSSNNMTLDNYLEHFKGGDHSRNAPFTKVWKKEKYARSGERHPDTYIDFEKCSICERWANQNHHWI